jgi:isopentenyl-diphosphate delta-isomerase
MNALDVNPFVVAEPEEHVVLVDEHGRELLSPEGQVRTLGKLAAHQQGVRHLAVSVFVFNSKNQLLLQQRALGKYHSAGLWTNTCCTHPRPGETPSACAARRLAEEMGLRCPLTELLQFAYRAEVGNGLIEDEYDHVFTGLCDDDPRPHVAEAGGWKWMDVRELERDLTAHPERYTYWLRCCYQKVTARSGD